MTKNGQQGMNKPKHIREEKKIGTPIIEKYYKEMQKKRCFQYELNERFVAFD